MAGLGLRFINAGYEVPKYMISVHGKTLFEWSMLSLVGCNDITKKYIFVVRKGYNCSSFIASQCKNLDIDNFCIIEIDYLTDGQATTALLASEYWDKDDSLLIYNIDTYVHENEILSAHFHGDGFIPCFHGKGDHWSFVKLNHDLCAVEVTEKVRISENCTLGAYYFKTARLYEDLYHCFYNKTDMGYNERYIAPLYNCLIQRGGKVYISNIVNEKVHVLGTPEELDAFANLRFI